jgi:hypothetical protein
VLSEALRDPTKAYRKSVVAHLPRTIRMDATEMGANPWRGKGST